MLRSENLPGSSTSLSGQRRYIFHQCLFFVFCFCFLAFRAEANLSHSAGGLVLRERHSWSNTDHLGSLSNGQSCIHLSSFLLCCLIESCGLRFASQTAILVSRRWSQPQYGWSSVPMACSLFAFSGKNILIFICLRRKSDLVSQPSSSSVTNSQRMSPRILAVPQRNFRGFFVQSCAHFTLDLMQLPGVNQPIQNSGQHWFISTANLKTSFWVLILWKWPR